MMVKVSDVTVLSTKLTFPIRKNRKNAKIPPILPVSPVPSARKITAFFENDLPKVILKKSGN